MKKIYILCGLLLFTIISYATITNKPYSYPYGSGSYGTGVEMKIDRNIQNLYNYFNGYISDSNVSSTANIQESKLNLNNPTHAQNTDTGTSSASFVVNSNAGAVTLDASSSTGEITINLHQLSEDESNFNVHIASTSGVHGASSKVSGIDDVETLTNKTLVTPVVADFTNANHNHSASSLGGTIDHTNLTNIGTNSHDQIDTHLGLTSSFHGTTVSAADVDDSVSKKHTQNTDTGTTSNTFFMGDGLSGTKTYYANNDHAAKPGWRYDDATSKWQFSNDGVAWTDIGSGGGITSYPNQAAFPACSALIVNTYATTVDTDSLYECNAVSWNIVASRTTVVSASLPMSVLGNNVSMTKSDSTQDGYLDKDDFLVFLSKQNALGYTPVPDTTTVNGHALTGNVSVTKTDLSLENVDNVQQMPLSYLDTDSNLTADSDSKVPSQKAVKAYADTKQSALGFTAVPDSRTVNGHALTGDVTVTSTDVGLGNVTNISRVEENTAVNPTAELATNPWTCDEHVTSSISTDKAGSPTHSFKFVADGTGGTCTAAFTTLPGRFQHDAYLYYSADTATTMNVYLGAALQNTQTLAVSTPMKSSEVNGHGTFVTDGTATAGTIALVIPASATVYTDDHYVGLNQNVGSVAQATFVGKVTYPAATCTAVNQIGTSMTNFYDSSCTPTLEGNVSFPTSGSDTLFGVTVPNAAAGAYFIVFSGGIYRESSPYTLTTQFFDGANVWGGSIAIGNGSTTSDTGINGTKIMPSGTFSVWLRGQWEDGTPITQLYSTIGTDATFSIYYFPSSSQTAVTVGSESAVAVRKITPSSTNVSQDAFGTYNNAAYASAVNYGIATAPDTTNDFGMSVKNLPPGLYRACVNSSFLTIAGSETYCNFRIYDGTTQIAGTYTDTTVNDTLTSICGTIQYSLKADRNFVVQADILAGNGTCRNYLNGGAEISLTPVSQNVPQPVIVNSVTHSRDTQDRTIRGVIASCGGSTTINAPGDGDWSIATDGTGACHITFSPAFASTNYSCTYGSQYARWITLTQTSASRLDISSALSASAATTDNSGPLSFICLGDK